MQALPKYEDEFPNVVPYVDGLSIRVGAGAYARAYLLRTFAEQVRDVSPVGSPVWCYWESVADYGDRAVARQWQL